LIKVSKDPDFYLVSNKNLSAVCPRVRWSEPKRPKTTPLMTSLTKNLKPKTKKFQLAESFMGLNSSPA